MEQREGPNKLSDHRDPADAAGTIASADLQDIDACAHIRQRYGVYAVGKCGLDNQSSIGLIHSSRKCLITGVAFYIEDVFSRIGVDFDDGVLKLVIDTCGRG